MTDLAKISSAAVFAVGLSAALVGCGGGGSGGGGSPAGSSPGDAQGYYAGNFSTAAFPAGRFATLVLDDDEIWTLYGTSGADGQLLVYGLIQGQGASYSGSTGGTLTGGTFAAPSIKNYYYTGTTGTGSLSATYQRGSSFNGTVSDNTGSVSFAGVVPSESTTNFKYGLAAQLTDITGAWAGTEMSGSTFNITIGVNGALAGSTTQGCTLSGQIQPRPGGKGVFNMRFTLASVAGCGTGAGISASGIAVTSLLSSNERQLIMAVVTNDRQYGTVLFAKR